jgi:hypothetical protein
MGAFLAATSSETCVLDEGAMFSLLQEDKTKQAETMAAVKLILRKPKAEVFMAFLF